MKHTNIPVSFISVGFCQELNIKSFTIEKVIIIYFIVKSSENSIALMLGDPIKTTRDGSTYPVRLFQVLYPPGQPINYHLSK